MPSGPLLNCIVHNHPEASGHWRASPGTILRKYTPALVSILQANMQPRLNSFTAPGPIDLTQLAANLNTALLRACDYDKHPAVYGFKAVMIVPAYERPHPSSQRGVYQSARHGNFVGLVAKGGHFLIDHIHVPMRGRLQLDLNYAPQPDGPITLHIFIAIPSLLASDGALPACGLCRVG